MRESKRFAQLLNEELFKVFKTADVDGSGKIDFNEFVAVIFSQKVDRETKEKALFSAFNDLAGGGSPTSEAEDI